MKKIILLLIPLLYIGCDKIPSGIVDSKTNNIQAVSISAPNIFVYNAQDSSFIISVKMKSSSNLSKVWANLYSSEGKLLNNNLIILEDNGNEVNGDAAKGDDIFSAKIKLSKYNPNGQYLIEYFVSDNENISTKIGIHNFNYYNGQQNYPPIISGLTAPDTLTVDVSGVFQFTIKVFDPNGQNDIKGITFQSFRPDGTTNGYQYDMYDDGQTASSGDKTAGDGIYSYINSFPSSVQKGNWKFVFKAIDRSDSVSNIITHNIYVK